MRSWSECELLAVCLQTFTTDHWYGSQPDMSSHVWATVHTCTAIFTGYKPNDEPTLYLLLRQMKTGVSLCVSQENSARISGGWHPIWPRLCSLPRSLPAVARWCCLEAWSLTRKVTWSGQGSAGRAGGRGGSHYPSVHSGSLYSGDRDEYFA